MKKIDVDKVQIDFTDFYKDMLTAYIDDVISDYAYTYDMTEYDVMTEDFDTIISDGLSDMIGNDTILDMLNNTAYNCIVDNHYTIDDFTVKCCLNIANLIWTRQKAFECN